MQATLVFKTKENLKKSLGNNNLTVHEVAGYNEAMKFRKSANFKVIGIVRGPV